MGLHQKFLASLTALFCVSLPAVSGVHPCSALRKLDNGQTFFRYGGLFATFSCRHGYRLHGHRTNSCVSGRWTREPPVCVGSGCPRPGPVAHGSVSVNGDASWVEFSCDRGYKLVGSSRLFCKGRGWNSSQPVCEEPDLMRTVLSRVTARKPPASQTLHATIDPQTTILSFNNTSNASVHLSMSSRSREQSKPRPQEEQPASASSEDQNIQILSTKLNIREPQPVTVPEKQPPPSTTTLSTSLASKPSLKPTPGRGHSHQTSPEGIQSQSPVPQTRSSGTSSQTQPNVASSSKADAEVVHPSAPESTSSSPQVTPSRNMTHPTILTNISCPYPSAPEHGTFYQRNEVSSELKETIYILEFVCDDGFTLVSGDAVRYCQEGATWSGDAPVCADVDECVGEQHPCQHICINTEGSFVCACHAGYEPTRHGTACADVDECAFTSAVTGCLFGCVNTPGSFYCLCPSGYTLLSPDHALCQDIDECADNQGLGPCSEHCHNTPGSFHCSCTYGFTLAGDGLTCIPECPTGYRKQPLGSHNSTLPAAGRCVDVNECEEEGWCEWKCVNLPGTYHCICPKGHIPTQDGRRCRDIDECSRRNGGCSHICVNLKGSYKCACPLSHDFAPYSWKNCVPRL